MAAKISAWRWGLGILAAMCLAGCAAPVKTTAPDTADHARMMEEALQAYGQGDCYTAIASFAELSRRAEHPATFNGLGLSYLLCRQPQDAIAPLEQAAVLAPSSPEIQANLGTAFFEAGELEQAEKAFRKALRLSPSQPEARLGMAAVHLRRDEPEAALQMLSRIAGKEAALPEVAYNRALAMQKMGLMEDAEKTLRTYAAEHPQDAEALNALGVVLLQRGELEEARGCFDKALALMPEEGRFYYNRAEAKKQQKLFAEALEDAGRAVVYAPDMAAAWVNRGELRFLLDDDANACLDLERACDLGLCERLEIYQKGGRCLTGFGSND